MASVSLINVRKQYGNGPEIIKGVDLEVKDGEFMVFVGPSGCGKSTMMRMIAGLEDITSGQLLIGGQIANAIPPAKRSVAMVFQSYALYPHMTVAQNMGFSLKMAGLKAGEIKMQVHATAQILQMTDLLDRKPSALSGGQRQRVAIGRAIVRKPGVFLFDEPLSNLDASLRVQMRLELTRLHQRLGSTLIYVTHDQTEAMTMGDRITVFNKGHIEQVGKPMELYNKPANHFVARFIGSPCMNILNVQCSRTGDVCDLNLPEQAQALRVAAPACWAGMPLENIASMGWRPEHLELLEHNDASGLTLPGHIEFIERLGDVSIVHVSTGKNAHAPLITVKLFTGQQHFNEKNQVWLKLDPTHAHLFDQGGQRLPGS